MCHWDKPNFASDASIIIHFIANKLNLTLPAFQVSFSKETRGGDLSNWIISTVETRVRFVFLCKYDKIGFFDI